MSSDKNKNIIEQAKTILEKQGYKVKTGHLYELFSKLVGESSWNVAKAKNSNFEKVLNFFKEEIPPAPNNNSKLNIKDLEKLIQEGLLKDKFLMGQINESGQLLVKDFFTEPNALFAGSMGSGKTIALMTMISTWLMGNSENSQLFIVDTLKGAMDYKNLFQFKQVHQIDTQDKINHLIDLLYDEAMARKEELTSVQAANIKDYELKKGKTISRCLVVFEEFHSIPYGSLDFDNQYKVQGSSANKLHTLFRIGRSLGIWFLMATQKATASDIPPSLIANAVNKMVFRISKAESSYLLGNIKAGELTASDRGVAESDWGKIVFSYFSPEDLNKLLLKYVKNLEVEGLVITSEKISKKLK